MRKKRILPLMAAAGLVLSARAQIFVSPSGRDANPGTAARPVATLAKAVELSRTLPGQAKQIRLGPGEFFDTGVTLTPADSGLTIESVPGVRATLLGGVPLSGWQKQDPRFWSAPLPPDRQWDVRMLLVNGRFCPRARFPEQGTLTHTSVFNVPWMSTTGGGWKRKPTQEELTTLQYKEGDLPPGLDLQNAEITVFHMWDESVARITRRDPTARTLTLSPPLGHPPGAFGVQKYCLWNIAEGMTRPGQWYFDRTRRRIVYWPLAGEDRQRVAAIVPTQPSVLRLAGATNVTLRDFNLEVTTVPLITGGFAAAAFAGAVQLDGAANATLTNLHIANVAGQAIKGMHRQNGIRVLDCTISWCGAGGVYLQGANNVVSNNVIQGVGLMFPSAMGINGGGEGCRLSHNQIDHTTYSAIGVDGRDLIIENNRISDCMKVLHDGAAIYCSGAKHSIIRNNYAHDIVDTGGYGASAYYLDEQCEDCVVEGNIALNVIRPSHNHMATNNVIRNNVFISQTDLRLTFPRCSGYRLEGNVLYAKGSISFEGINHIRAWSSNIVFSKTGKLEASTLKDYSVESTYPLARSDTLVADPQFRALEKLDLRYGPNSPARQLGLEPLAVSMAGPVGPVKTP